MPRFTHQYSTQGASYHCIVRDTGSILKANLSGQAAEVFNVILRSRCSIPQGPGVIGASRIVFERSKAIRVFQFFMLAERFLDATSFFHVAGLPRRNCNLLPGQQIFAIPWSPTCSQDREFGQHQEDPQNEVPEGHLS